MCRHTLCRASVLSAREGARDTAARRVVGGSADCGSSLLSALKGNGEKEVVGRSKSVRRRRDLSYGQVSGVGSRRSECRDPDAAVSSVGRAENSLDSGSSRKVHGLVTNSEKVVFIAVMKATSSFTWQEDFATKLNE